VTPAKLSFRRAKYPDSTRSYPFISQFTSPQHVPVINGIHPIGPLTHSWPPVFLVLGIHPVSHFNPNLSSWSLLSTGLVGELASTTFVPPLMLCLKNLSSTDVSHVWLSIFDTVSLMAFLMEVLYQYQTNSLSFDATKHGDSAARLWLALTARQTCLLIILTITLINIRLGRSTCFGSKHIFLWLSTIGMVGTGVIAAALLSIFGFTSLFGGIAVYLSVVTILAVSILGFLVTTLWRIRYNLEKDREVQDIDSWPIPPRKRRISFTTDEVRAMKDGASWITSIEGSARRSLSPWSFSASHNSYPKSKHVARHSMPTSFYSLPTGSIVSETNATKREQEHVPPFPPLPSPYQKTTQGQTDTETSEDPTPTSWLTSLSGAKTMSPFSFPTTRAASLKTIASRLAGRRERDMQPHTGTTAVFPVTFVAKPDRVPHTSTMQLQSLVVTSTPTNHIVTTPRVITWLAMICLPFVSRIVHSGFVTDGPCRCSPCRI
jgi:hypothetical protein